MRLKLGFLLRAVLLLGSFLGLLLLWSSLSPRAEEPSPKERIRGLAATEGCRRTDHLPAGPRSRLTLRRRAGALFLSSSGGRLRRLLLSLARLRPVALARPEKGDVGGFGRVRSEPRPPSLSGGEEGLGLPDGAPPKRAELLKTVLVPSGALPAFDNKESIDRMPNNGDHGLIPGNDKFKPVLPWPHVEGVEVDLESIRRRNKAKNEGNPLGGNNDQQNIMQRQYLTFKPQTLIYHDPVLRPGILGNFEPKEPEPHGVVGGPGEEAKPYVLGPEYKESIQASIKEFGFNMVASDMISLDRSVNDLRQEECKYWHYDENLLTSSVVIVFHNEGWSTLMRTVHSVVKRTPRKYLAEIVLIDDFSNKAHLKERLEDYIKQWNGLVKIFRNERREGLIQARSIGAQKAKLGQVLIYLDAHCEVAVNWYAPLIAPISKDR
ncbi:N-acetylgalactosaminyltransferase 7 [Varanus komodoensis]|nr:N-acetylgalactosaminyltransferase 7 [Varanus komodoensis]